MYTFKKQLLFILSFIFILSASAKTETLTYFDLPNPGYISNVMIDIIKHDGAMWFATGEGLNYTEDDGDTWLYYDEDNGLVSSSISALFSVPSPSGQRIWVATNHEENIDGKIFGLSDGVSFSDNNGDTWNQIDFETAPNDIPYVWGGDRTIFDIAAHYDPLNEDFDNWVFFTAFAGGFLASADGGTSWRRIFPTRADSIQFYTAGTTPSLRNRYFSCAADTSHGDSLYLWAGTAGGLFQYVFVEAKEKAYTKFINAVAFCENCGENDSSYIYYGGSTGFTRGTKQSNNYMSRFEDDGLSGSSITAMLDFGGKLFVGATISDVDSTSTGLDISTDFGETFTHFLMGPFEGLNNRISDFAVINDRIYMAVENSGIAVSVDTGSTWQQIIPDSSVGTIGVNIVHSLNAWGDTLRVGTDSGLVQIYFDPAGVIDSTRHTHFDENANSSAKIVDVETQLFEGNEVIWTVNIPHEITVGSPIIARSDDGGVSFVPFNYNAYSSDIAFLGDTTLVVGDSGIVMSDNAIKPLDPFAIYEYFYTDVDTFVVDSLNNDLLTTIDIKGDTIVIGSQNGFAVSLDRGQTFEVTRVNLDSLTADLVLHYTSSIEGIDGDWIPALDIQYETTDPVSRVWTSVRPTYGGAQGISVGYSINTLIIDTTTVPHDTTVSSIRLWENVYDNYAWNFAFAGDTVFAATNDGLIYAEGDSLITIFGGSNSNWKTLEMKDEQGYDLLLDGTPVYAVEVDDNYIWVGTDDRTIRVRRDSVAAPATPLYVIDDKTSADEVYAFPVPFSQVRDNQLEFRFVVEQQADITLEVYDFAMNLVKRVIDNEPFEPNFYPTAGYGRRTWDGLNGKGDEVAVGVYYFKVEYSTGEVRWGKLVVIP